ncbi:MAG: rRNA maturation RNase YbeY [Clostridia bacterium]|nr:rRNA maturation RNase YbeY [Clostridia bacterium]
MRFSCHVDVEQRGILPVPEKRKYQKILRAVFKEILEGSATNLVTICEAHAVDGAEVHVSFTNNQGIQAYNCQYRDIDRPTDVLSFPLSDFNLGQVTLTCDNINPENNYLSLGDIVISVERMREQAEELGHSQTREVAFLMCHSVLHLLGYDHMTPEDEERMQFITEETLTKLGYTRDYIDEGDE